MGALVSTFNDITFVHHLLHKSIVYHIQNALGTHTHILREVNGRLLKRYLGSKHKMHKHIKRSLTSKYYM